MFLSCSVSFSDCVFFFFLDFNFIVCMEHSVWLNKCFFKKLIVRQASGR
jgi:hypothetical protein